MMQSVLHYQSLLKTHLTTLRTYNTPKNLYDPIHYILELGGKRLRPVLTLMTTDAFGGNAKEALHAATAIELFHNFSLIHDDIMDAAPLRRGKPTVHKKWNENTGILSGDAMLVMAYQYFEVYSPVLYKKLISLFSTTALQVCEGQQLDMDFENRDDVTIDEYLHMITYKTAVLVACAMQMGAIIGNADEKDEQTIYDFGLNLGIAFQLQDDYLDAFGNPETFGKQVGGDIIENKKTYLYLKAKELAIGNDVQQLAQWFAVKPEHISEKISAVTQIFKNTKADMATMNAIKHYTEQAFRSLQETGLSPEVKLQLEDFGRALMSREI